MSTSLSPISATFILAVSSPAMAAEPEASGDVSGGVSLGSDDGTSADGSADAEAARPPRAKDRGDIPWIRRWAPERGRHMGELGVYGGVMLPSRRLELFEPDTNRPDQGFKTFGRVVPDVGVRLGYYPLRFFGVEGEAGVLPTRTEDDLAATLWTMRMSFVGQLGLWSVTPFVLVGGGMLNVASDRAAVGSDIDAAVHFGGGVKFYLSRYTQLRLDIRDTITAGQGVDDGVIHNPEVLLGFSIVLGRKKRERGPRDTDGDGIYDPDDACVEEPGVPEYDGCPVPDTDGDGILDPDDQCVDVPGVVEYEGCPIPDTDGDGILDPDDQCVDVPESFNGYEDEDGCPDELPKEVQRFSGVIEGIFFDTNKDIIKPASEVELNEALEVLRKFPGLRVEISGHTDSRGSRELNIDLSKRRAEAVERWLVERGIADERMTTRGVGPDEPLDSNRSSKGRARNRRIEFKLLTR